MINGLYKCGHCNAYVEMESLYQYGFAPAEDGPNYYEFLKCKRCGYPILIYEYFLGEYEEAGSIEAAFETSYCYGGDEVEKPDEFPLSIAIPPVVQRPFAEAKKCFSAGILEAAAVMCRKTLEALCHDKGIQSGTLSVKLEAMQKAKIIDQRLLEWAHALRLAGNMAAHDVETPFTAENAQDTMAFTYTMLEYIYIFQARYEAFHGRLKQPSS